MVGVSVALQSKQISEATQRDSSALKSLTVLAALFFPAAYVAVSQNLLTARKGVT
jgi:hypothetical protein